MLTTVILAIALQIIPCGRSTTAFCLQRMLPRLTNFHYIRARAIQQTIREDIEEGIADHSIGFVVWDKSNMSCIVNAMVVDTTFYIHNCFSPNENIFPEVIMELYDYASSVNYTINLEYLDGDPSILLFF